MKVAVIFFSLTGQTRRIARLLEVGDTELIEVKAGLRALSLLGMVRAPRFDPVRYDLMVIGCPVWYNGAARPFLKALGKLDFRGKQVNLFVTYAIHEGNGMRDLAAAVGRSNGSIGRRMHFKVSRPVNEHEVRKLRSF